MAGIPGGVPGEVRSANMGLGENENGGRTVGSAAAGRVGDRDGIQPELLPGRFPGRSSSLASLRSV